MLASEPIGALMSKRVNRLTKKGFTLIELLVTASILGMIAVVIFSTFASGLNVYKCVQVYGGVQADLLLSLENMERDLRNVFSFSEIDFIGYTKKIIFIGLIKELDSTGNQNVSLGRISYYLDSKTSALIKEKQSYPQALSENRVEESDFNVLAFIEDINFNYYYYNQKTQTYEWKVLWCAGEGIPKGVKIEASFKDGNRSVKLVRTVFIPVSGEPINQ